MRSYKAGDRVAYSAAFCRSIGCQTGEIPAMRGTVKRIREMPPRRLVYVLWDGDETQTSVLEANLAIVGANSKFCAC